MRYFLVAPRQATRQEVFDANFYSYPYFRRAGYCGRGGENCPAGLPVDGGALRAFYPDAAAGIKLSRAVYGPNRPQSEHDGAGARHPLAGGYLPG